MERQARAHTESGLPEEQRAVVSEAAAQPADGVERLLHFIQRLGNGDDVEPGNDVGIAVVRIVGGTQERFFEQPHERVAGFDGRKFPAGPRGVKGFQKTAVPRFEVQQRSRFRQAQERLQLFGGLLRMIRGGQSGGRFFVQGRGVSGQCPEPCLYAGQNGLMETCFLAVVHEGGGPGAGSGQGPAGRREANGVYRRVRHVFSFVDVPWRTRGPQQRFSV